MIFTIHREADHLAHNPVVRQLLGPRRIHFVLRSGGLCGHWWTGAEREKAESRNEQSCPKLIIQNVHRNIVSRQFVAQRMLRSPQPERLVESWGERRGLNPRPSVPQTDALPAELRSPQLPLEYHVSGEG